MDVAVGLESKSAVRGQAWVCTRPVCFPLDVVKELGKKAFAYWGEEVAVALPLTAAQVEPALPPIGAVGVVELTSVVDGRLLDQLNDPACLKIPANEWPSAPPRATTILADPSEWEPLAHLLLERGICRYIPLEEVFSPGGTPGINGLFGISKNKCMDDGREILRLICNLVPTNSYLHVIRGEVDELPYIMQWTSFALLESEEVRVSQEIMTAAFYCFRMPPQWRPYFAVGLPLPGSYGGRSPMERGYLAVTVLPMGFGSTVGVMQAAARSILSQALTPLEAAWAPAFDGHAVVMTLSKLAVPENTRINVGGGNEGSGRAMCLGLVEDYYKGPRVSNASFEFASFTRWLNGWVQRHLPAFD